MSALVTRVFKSRTKFPKIEKMFYRLAPNRSTDPRQPHKTKSSPFQRRSRDEDDLRKKTPRLGNRGEKGIFIQSA